MRKRRHVTKSENKSLRSKISTKTLVCEKKGCTREIEVDSSTESVICWECVQNMVGCDAKYLVQPGAKVEKTKSEDGFPRGYHLYKQFVHADGRVFEKGKENTTLKGTLPVTQVKVNTLTKTERRKLREAKKEKKEARLAKRYAKKMKMKGKMGK